MRADLLIRAAAVFDVPGADTVAVRSGRIAGVGSWEELAGLIQDGTRVLEFPKGVILPGFVDAHTHFLRVGLERVWYIDLGPARSLDEALELIRQGAEAVEGEWVLGRGWDESRWEDGVTLKRVHLDRALPDRPCCAIRVDGHLCICNSRALERLGIGPGSLVDPERGELREAAVEEALRRVPLEPEVLLDAVAASSELHGELGITAAADMGTEVEHIRAYKEAARRGTLKTRLFLYLPWRNRRELAELGSGRETEGGLVRVMGLKLFADGSIGAHTAALTTPYRDTGDVGLLLLSQAELSRAFREARELGVQLAVHAIGNRAVAEVLAGAEEAGVSPAERHRIEHLELLPPDGARRMARLGLIASMQPNFVVNWSGPGKLYEERLGAGRDRSIDPHRELFEAGIPLAFGSDGMPPGPLYGLRGAITPPHPLQRLPPREAIRAYTVGGAYSLFADEEFGEIAPGKAADLVVLSGDPRREPLGGIRVELTLLGGKIIFQRCG